MDSGVKCVEEIDNADKQLVESVKSLLREVRGPFPESSLRRISYTVYLTDPAIPSVLLFSLSTAPVGRSVLPQTLIE